MKFGKELERLRKFGKVPWTTRLLDYYIARLERLVLNQKKLQFWLTNLSFRFYSTGFLLEKAREQFEKVRGGRGGRKGITFY